MKILKDNSIFYNLPQETSLKEFLIIDAVRFSFEIVEANYNQLVSLLEKASETNSRNVSQTFHLAWSIIDYSNRINDLLFQLEWEDKKGLLEDIQYLKDFRNTFQHLGVRSSAVTNKYTPFFGLISWFYFNTDTRKHKLHYLISGVARRTDMKWKVPDTSKFDKPINNITLHTVNNKKVIKSELTEVVADLTRLAQRIELSLEFFLNKTSLKRANWESRRDIHIILKPDDYE